jgi:hypothetical protein
MKMMLLNTSLTSKKKKNDNLSKWGDAKNTQWPHSLYPLSTKTICYPTLPRLHQEKPCKIPGKYPLI